MRQRELRTCKVADAAFDVGVVGTFMEAFGEWETVVCSHEGAKQEAGQEVKREMHSDLLRGQPSKARFIQQRSWRRMKW